jgi:hypothetical protein
MVLCFRPLTTRNYSERLPIIRWVNALGKEWGRWRKRNEPQWATISLLGRIRDEGLTGAAIKQHGQRIPVKFMPPEIAQFHRAWLTLAESQRIVCEVNYHPGGSAKIKARTLSMSTATLYRVLDHAQVHLSIAIERDSQILRPTKGDMVNTR